MMIGRPFLILFLPVLFFSCGKRGMQEIKVENKFSLSIPESFVSIRDTALRSSLYYSDTLRNMALIVVEESKDSMTAYGLNYTLKKYFDKTSKSLMDKIQGSHMNVSYPDTIKGNNAMLGNITGDMQGEKVFYRLAIIETKKNFYQLIWAMVGESPGRFETEMSECIYSFKEL